MIHQVYTYIHGYLKRVPTVLTQMCFGTKSKSSSEKMSIAALTIWYDCFPFMEAWWRLLLQYSKYVLYSNGEVPPWHLYVYRYTQWICASWAWVSVEIWCRREQKIKYSIPSVERDEICRLCDGSNVYSLQHALETKSLFCATEHTQTALYLIRFPWARNCCCCCCCVTTTFPFKFSPLLLFFFFQSWTKVFLRISFALTEILLEDATRSKIVVVDDGPDKLEHYVNPAETGELFGSQNHKWGNETGDNIWIYSCQGCVLLRD